MSQNVIQMHKPKTMFTQLMNEPSGSGLYFKHKNKNAEGVMTFEKHFNPDLPLNSNYFRSLDNLMKCVAKNADVSVDQQDKVCLKEFKKLRINAFNNELMYHNVHKKYFVNELYIKNGISPL